MKTKTTTQSMDLKPGQVVKIHQKIKEGAKERIQIFEGLVIDVKNKSGMHHHFTVRRVVDGIGVEKVFNVHSPFIDKIEMTKESKVNRAKLSYMRNRTGKAGRMKDETILSLVFGEKKAEEAPIIESAKEEKVEAKA